MNDRKDYEVKVEQPRVTLFFECKKDIPVIYDKCDDKTLAEAEIMAQIGVVQPWYNKLFKPEHIKARHFEMRRVAPEPGALPVSVEDIEDRSKDQPKPWYSCCWC